MSMERITIIATTTFQDFCANKYKYYKQWLSEKPMNGLWNTFFLSCTPIVQNASFFLLLCTDYIILQKVTISDTRCALFGSASKLQTEFWQTFWCMARWVFVFSFCRGMMDEEGNQFVAYFLPNEDTMRKRKRDFEEDIDFMPEEL